MTADLRALHARVAALTGPDPTVAAFLKLPEDWTADAFSAFRAALADGDLSAALRFMRETLPGWVPRISLIRFGMWRVEMWDGDKSFNAPTDANEAHPDPAIALILACLSAIDAKGE